MTHLLCRILQALTCAVFALAFAQSSPVQAQAPDKPPTPDALRLREDLLTLAAGYSGSIGIAIQDLTTGEEFLINAEQKFSQAGLSKIYVLAALLHEASAGHIDLAELHKLSEQDKLPGGILYRLGNDSVTMSLHDYAALMVTIDDNSATNIILGRLGPDAVNASLKAFDASDIHFAGLITDPKNPDDNRASARAIVNYLSSLYRGHGLNNDSREEFFSLLSTPRLGALRTAVPRHIRVASKSGIRGNLRCSAAIVFLKNHPYAVAVMTQPAGQENDTENDAATAISNISRLCYHYFAKQQPQEPAGPSQ